MILFLHGAGERGSDPQRLLRAGLPQRLTHQPGFPAIVLAPQCPRRTTWLDHLEAVEGLLDEVVGTLHGDPDRVHVTGLSLGGMGAWLLATRAPQRFASVVPICGPVPPLPGFPAAVGALQSVAVWAFHGIEDPMVSVRHTLAMVDVLERAGGRPRVTLYADVGHRAWELAYADPDLGTWFLERTRGLKARVRP